MGSQYKASENGSVGGEVKVAAAAATASEMRVRYVGFGLRLLGLVLTLVAAVVVGVDKESKTISISLTDSMPPLHFHVTAKFDYTSSLVFFVVSNSMACTYAAISLVLSTVTSRCDKNGMTVVLILLDLIILGLLCSANGAAAGVGVIARDGNSHLHWEKVCNLFESYCNHMFAALVLSILGSLAFLCLVMLAAWNLHKKSK